MKIYIDFDGTLYNTDELYIRFINILKKYNIKEKQIQYMMEQDQYQNNKSFDILSKNIIKKYNLNEEILKEIDNIYSENLVYPDVIPFLEEYSKKYDLILLTLGNIPYQQKKIYSSNISKYFKDIIITDKDKSKLDIDYTQGIFIDNNPKELERFYNSKAAYLIRIKRNNEKYSKVNLKIDNRNEYTNFKEISKYIDTIGGFKHE